jgi:sugar/nucleoside kinase (ribokinase family)
MESPKITIVGYLNIDINRYPGKPEEILPGGAAYFVVLAASLFNSSVGIVSTIGNDFPIEKLGPNIRLDGAKKLDMPASKSIQTYHDANDFSKRDLELFEGAGQKLKPEDIPADWIQESKWIHVATMPPEIQLPFMKYLREKDTKATISVDTDFSFLKQEKYKPLIEEIFSFADVVFMNRYEYEFLKDAIKEYPTTVVKKDSDGAELYKKGVRVEATGAPETECIDATGAGDIFAGTYMAEIVNGKSEKEALKKAVEQATMSVSKIGIDHLL